MDAAKRASTGKGLPDVCRDLGISISAFYKRPAKYGGMHASMVSHMKVLEEESR